MVGNDHVQPNRLGMLGFSNGANAAVYADDQAGPIFFKFAESFIVKPVAFIYPISGYWKWGGGWLAEMGFQDFAGSAVVHGLGGFAGLFAECKGMDRSAVLLDQEQTPIHALIELSVGQKIDDQSDVLINGVNINEVLTRMRFAKNFINFVFLDACRDNPFEKKKTSTFFCLKFQWTKDD